MTILKKSLAMFLALVMMFSTMSVAANAAGKTETLNDDISFTVKFFREDPENPGSWIETTKAAPGESVKARIYIETGYYTVGGDACFIFSKDYFDLPDFENNVMRDITANENYGGGAYKLEASAVWKENISEWESNKHMDYIAEEIENDADFFEKYDIISNNIVFGSKIKNDILSDSDWMYEFDLTVKDSDVTNTVGSQGDAEVPPYYFSPERTVLNHKGKEVTAELFIDFSMGEEGTSRDGNVSMWEWDPDFGTTAGAITTTSEIVFDMGLVDDSGNWVEDTYTIEEGIIGTEVDLNAVANPAHPDGMVFAYWSTQKPGEAQEQAVAVEFDYDATTLYAVWSEPEDVSYTLNQYFMNADGTYPTEVQSTTLYAAPNSTVTAPESADNRFFLDEEMSTMSVVVNADGSSVVNAYYERNKYNLVYHYEDMNGEAAEIVPTYFGADLPAFSDHPSGEPLKNGYEFLGWTTVKGGTTPDAPATMPTEELHLYPVYDPIKVTFIFDALEGTFSDGNSIMRYEYDFGDEVITPEEPTVPGMTFVDWDIELPETATEDLTFEAIYEPDLYTVTFMADMDEDGEYETIVAEEYFGYGELIYTEFAPENYPIDAWEFEDGTEFVFSDNDDEAYEVTGDLVLYTTGADEYPARFYLTQEDLDNGEEPYETIYVPYGESIEAPEAPAAEDIPGYNFLAWIPDVDSGLIMDTTEGMDFVAILEAKEITVTFDPNEGECEEDEITGTYGESIVLPEVSREGYELLGWYNGTEKVGVPGDEYALPTEDATLVAKWKGEKHSVIFVDTDGKEIGRVEAETDAPVVVPEELANPEKTGYEFAGWDSEIPETMPAEDVTITATWNELFDVTYKNEDGSVFESFVDAGVAGDAIPVPADKPSKEGHYFDGWVDANGNTVTTIPEGNIDLYPKFEANPTYTITYKDGEEVVNTATYEEGEAIAEYTLGDKEGYTFDGWEPALPATMPAEDLEVVAKWAINTNDVIYMVDGVEYDRTKDVAFGTEVTVIAEPTKTGYTFSGWDKTTFTMPDDDVVVSGTFTVNEYTITFDTDGGNELEPVAFDYGEEISGLPVPEKAGHVFAGWTWTNEDGETIAAPETMPAYNVTATASWDVAKHTVNYYLAENGELYDSFNVEEGATFVHPEDPTVEGLTFVAWVDEDGNELPDEMVMGTEDIKIYAKFDVNSYKVTYIVDGEVYAEYDVLYQAEVPVPADPEDSEIRKFAGWSPAPVAVMPAKDLTYTATWADPEPDKYTATFLRDDGNVHSMQVLAEGDTIVVPEGPQKFGYVFVGWNPEVPETMPAEDLVFEPQYEIDKTFVTIVIGGTVVAGGVIAASIANAATITGISIVGGVIVLVGVAELVKHTHTVTYLVDGEVYKTYKVVKGMKIPVPADPAKDGFIFEGWNPEVPSKMGDEDLVFEATWTEKSADDSEVDVEIPATGSVAGGLAAFAAIAGAAAAAYVATRKKKED